MQRVFVDANVLFGVTPRDWLFLLREQTGAMFQTHSTEDVIAEVLHSFRRKWPAASGGEVTRLRTKLIAALDEIIEDFDATIPYVGRDEHDRHVHAAAVAGYADILLTADGGLSDTDGLPYSVYHPDDFFILIDDSAPHAVRAVVQQQMRYWGKKPGSKGLCEALIDAHCPQFAARVDGHFRELAGAT